MEDGKISLSRRLMMLARMVTPENRVADVGCDHGFLSIYLVQAGISPGVIAMDVRRGPLAAAREHVGAWGLGAYIETRLSNGLQNLLANEADTVVCAGMGGRLMERILTEGRVRALQMKELILQPQSEIPEFRKFLRQAGFLVVSEDMVCEDGKYYFAMRAVPGPGTGTKECVPDREMRLYDRFGKRLLGEKHPLLLPYLRLREEVLLGIVRELTDQDSKRAKRRLLEIQEELKDIRSAMALLET